MNFKFFSARRRDPNPWNDREVPVAAPADVGHPKQERAGAPAYDPLDPFPDSPHPTGAHDAAGPHAVRATLAIELFNL